VSRKVPLPEEFLAELIGGGDTRGHGSFLCTSERAGTRRLRRVVNIADIRVRRKSASPGFNGYPSR
jgi:hypothetical protein